jgi:hypothetical protein
MSTKESCFHRVLNTRALLRFLLISALTPLMLAVVFRVANAQIQTVPPWVGNLLLQNSTITADPAMTAPEAQGLGQKFELLFAMINNQDPQNSDNDVISVLATPGTFATPGAIGVAVRNMLPGVKIGTLTNQISLKYLFAPPRDCGGGSPRIQLFIDPGDGTSPRNAFGYVGNAPFGTACISDGNWHFQNMTDMVGRWDLSQFGGPMTDTWTQVVAFFNTMFPNHVVLSGGVYDDSCSVSQSFVPPFAPLSCGQAYYDLVTVENRTLENRQDTVQGPTH